MIQSLLPTQKSPKGVQLNLGDWSTKGLVGYWLMNEGSGNKVFDLSGNGNDGTLVHSPPWVSGKFGSALQFDGANDYGSIPAAAIDKIEAVNAFTIVSWVYNTDLTQDGTVMGQWGTTNQFIIWMDTGGVDGYAAIIQGGGDLTRTGEAVASAIANTWQQVVGAWDGTTISIYVDGILSDSTVGARTLNSASELIGIASDEGDIASRSFPGIIDHVMIYNRALSASEIALLYREPFRAVTPEWMSVFELASQSAVGANPKGPLSHPLCGALAGPISF